MPILMTASSQTLCTLYVIEAGRKFAMPGEAARILNDQSFTPFSAIERRDSKIPRILDSRALARITANIFN